MWLICGLGNPGPKYRRTRHNVGFMVVDLLAEKASAGPFKEKLKGELTRASLGGQEVVLLKPMTFMNLSGEALQPAMTFFKVPLSNVIVVHDELDLPFRDVRVKVGGGAAGHNGLKSIIQTCGGPDFVRVRIGIGRPPVGSTESWVLGEPDPTESASLPGVLQDAALAAEMVVRDGPARAQNKLNARAAPPKPGQ
jgi:PTH1 family peptidyl-tRNA hydrolase